MSLPSPALHRGSAAPWPSDSRPRVPPSPSPTPTPQAPRRPAGTWPRLREHEPSRRASTCDVVGSRRLDRRRHRQLGRLDVLVNNAGIIRDNRIERHHRRRLACGRRRQPRRRVPRGARRAAGDEGAALRPDPLVLVDVLARQLRAGQLRGRQGGHRGTHPRRRTRGRPPRGHGQRDRPGADRDADAGRHGCRRARPADEEDPGAAHGGPTDIAAAAAFLCSEEARYITGVVLDVDGGIGIGSSIREARHPRNKETNVRQQHTARSVREPDGGVRRRGHRTAARIVLGRLRPAGHGRPGQHVLGQR